MRVSVVVHDEDGLDRAPHPKVLVVVLQALKACGHARVFLWLRVFGAECEVRQGVPGLYGLVVSWGGKEKWKVEGGSVQWDGRHCCRCCRCCR
jgi:hypothetical protein